MSGYRVAAGLRCARVVVCLGIPASSLRLADVLSRSWADAWPVGVVTRQMDFLLPQTIGGGAINPAVTFRKLSKTEKREECAASALVGKIQYYYATK